MNRLIAVTALIAALALPTSAGAEVAYSGKGQDFRVRFSVITERGVPKRITRFKFRNVTMTCAQGDPFTTDSEDPHFGPLRVNRDGEFGRAFRGAGPTGEVTVVIRGEFTSRRKVEGTLRIFGDYPPTHFDCTSGKLAWTAELT